MASEFIPEASDTLTNLATDSFLVITSSLGIIPGLAGTAAVKFVVPAVKRLMGNADKEHSRKDFSISEILYNDALVAQQKGNYQDCIDLLERSAKLGNDKALMTLASTLSETDRPAAVALLEELAPHNADAKLMIADLVRATDPAKAETIYRELGKKKNESALLGLASLLIGQGNVEEAEEVLLVNVKPLFFTRDNGIRLRSAELLAKTQETSSPKHYLRFYETMAKRGDTYAMNELGLHFAKEDPQRAIKYFREAASAGLPVAYTNLAHMVRDSDPTTAIELCIKALKMKEISAVSGLAVASGKSFKPIQKIKKITSNYWKTNPSNPELVPVYLIGRYARGKYQKQLLEYGSKRGRPQSSLALAAIALDASLKDGAQDALLLNEGLDYLALAVDQGIANPFELFDVLFIYTRDLLKYNKAASQLAMDLIAPYHPWAAKWLMPSDKDAQPEAFAHYDALRDMKANHSMQTTFDCFNLTQEYQETRIRIPQKEFNSKHPGYEQVYALQRPTDEVTRDELKQLVDKIAEVLR